MGAPLGAEGHSSAFVPNNDGVVKQAVEQGGSDHRTAKDLAAFGAVPGRDEDHRHIFVAWVEELEETRRKWRCPNAGHPAIELRQSGTT